MDWYFMSCNISYNEKLDIQIACLDGHPLVMIFGQINVDPIEMGMILEYEQNEDSVILFL